MAKRKDAIDLMIDEVKQLARPRDQAGEGGVLVRGWAEVSPTAHQMMSIQDAMGLIIALLIFGLAGLGILNTMLMSVFERTKELGVMIALGLKPRQVMALILLETLVLTTLAMVLGLALGGLIDLWMVTKGLYWGNSFEFSGVVFDPTIKGVVRPQGIVAVVIALFVISVLASLWPAARAARLRPVTAMREES